MYHYSWFISVAYTNACRTTEIPRVLALFMLSQITAAGPAVSFTNTD